MIITATVASCITYLLMKLKQRRQRTAKSNESIETVSGIESSRPESEENLIEMGNSGSE